MKVQVAGTSLLQKVEPAPAKWEEEAKEKTASTGEEQAACSQPSDSDLTFM